MEVTPFDPEGTAYLAASLPYSFAVTVADNASTDATYPIACRLAAELPEVHGRRPLNRTEWSGHVERHLDLVAAHYTATAVGGQTVYDLTRAATS